jgi:hypothetical protein
VACPIDGTKHGRRVGVECKRFAAPTLTPSMRIALDDLKLVRFVVYSGDCRHPRAERALAVLLGEMVGEWGRSGRHFQEWEALGVARLAA